MACSNEDYVLVYHISSIVSYQEICDIGSCLSDEGYFSSHTLLFASIAYNVLTFPFQQLQLNFETKVQNYFIT